MKPHVNASIIHSLSKLTPNPVRKILFSNALLVSIVNQLIDSSPLIYHTRNELLFLFGLTLYFITVPLIFTHVACSCEEYTSNNKNPQTIEFWIDFLVDIVSNDKYPDSWRCTRLEVKPRLANLPQNPWQSPWLPMERREIFSEAWCCLVVFSCCFALVLISRCCGKNNGELAELESEDERHVGDRESLEVRC